MPLQIYNSLTRQKEEFVPLTDGLVRMYVCGPTVYDYPHIGHAKSYISFDIVVRYLRYLGYRVKYVQNITDVGHLLDDGEDRILKGAQREKRDPMELVEIYTRAFFDAMDALNVQRPTISPRATGHIPEQIEMVQTLIDKGHAYVVNGSVYFDISTWPGYGVLSGRRVEDQRAGERVEASDEKRHPADFALWKKAGPEHIMQWNSPWGRGYPGWHIECSAMSMKYLGETLDIHGGGMENQFPHHECEIAQSEAVTGKPFVRYWMHHNMVMVEGVKMSKSLGNFTSVQRALERYSGAQIRFFILQSHYRSPVDFSREAIDASAQGLERLQATRDQLLHFLASDEGDVSAQVEQVCAEYKALFEKEMNDDFNTPAAIGHLFSFAREINSRLSSSLSSASVKLLHDTFIRLADDVLGILPESRTALAADPFIDLLVTVRREIRAQKNWALSDHLRDKLEELGVAIQDGKEKSSWTYKKNMPAL
ncbi:cysteine--tRNA ligase [candidate division KSB1 bacterium]|nr:cysteine--tRNA ligase [candidate division KSB1 bacterium]RQW07507.1 MAG: cysteine--tRNA ligase [candidate division KSB1 bacterium]